MYDFLSEHISVPLLFVHITGGVLNNYVINVLHLFETMTCVTIVAQQLWPNQLLFPL